MSLDEIGGWAEGFDEVMARIAPRLGRVEPRRRARGYLLGLLSPMAGKNSWTIAEAAGDATPDGMQRLLNDYRWDADTSVTTCAATWLSTSVRQTACSLWTRPAL